jgi:multiple sugar transport system substrate-binding protein
LKPTFHRNTRSLAVLVAMSMIVPIAAACSKSDADDPNNRRTLRIGMLYGSKDNESYFRQQYTDMFELAHGNIDIELVNAIDYSDSMYESNEERMQKEQPDPVEKLKEIMTGANPVDVVMLDTGTLGKLVQENLLKPLDPLIKEDKVDLEAYVPSILDTIREKGNGQLYGLSPTFSASALFYNKKLFQQAGVEVPTDGMNWDDVFNLAKRLKSGTGKDAVYGLTLNDWGGGLQFYNVQNIVSPLKLRMFDDKGEKMTVDTPQWERAWNEPIQLYKDRVIPHQEDLRPEQPADGNYRYNPYQERPFFTGRVAMTIGGFSLVNDLITFNQNVDKMKGYEKLDWDVVTYPVLPEMPDVGPSVYLSELTGINANAQNPDDAWEFVKFINSKETAKFKARSNYELSTLKEFIKPRDGSAFNIEAFYKLKPALYESSDAEEKLYRERPNLSLVNQLADLSFQKALSGKMTVKEALADWQKKGDELLQKIKANPKGEIDMTPYMDNSGLSPEKEAAMRAAGEIP